MNEMSKNEKELLNELISGKTKTESPYINYSLGQIREKSASMKILGARHSEALKAVNQIQKELISLDAEIAAREIDIIEFSKIEGPSIGSK